MAKRSLEGKGARRAQVALPAGAEASRHSHERFVQVIAGSGILETERGRVPFAAGSLFHFLPSTWHAASFETDMVLVETSLP